MTRFRSVVLDVDSTLSGIEGIDWLATRRSEETARQVKSLTELAMSGEKSLDEVFGLRLLAVRPCKADLRELASAYISAVAPGAREVIAAIKAAGVRVVLVSGGIRDAILPLATRLGIPSADVHAVDVHFSEDGKFAGFDTGNDLTRQIGKRLTVERLALPPAVLAVGDGMTDAEMGAMVDCFAAFTGFARRGPVIALADETIESFNRLKELVLQ